MDTKRSAAPSREGRRVGYVIAILVNLLMLYVAHNLENWGLPFITGEFGRVLPALDLAILAAAGANALLLINDAPWFRALLQIFQGLAGFWAAVTLFRVFPFDFGSDFINSLSRVVLALVMLGILVGLVLDLFRLVTGRAGR